MSTLSVIGHNNPPEPTPFELSSEEIDLLFMEATNWCDGEPIVSQEQADAVSGLLDQIRAASKRADERRKEEARPHDEAKAEIQARYNTLIGDLKSAKGRAVLASEACKKALEPWRLKVEAEKRAAAEAARKEAEAKAAAAQAAFKSSQVDDLESRARAEELAAEAKAAERVASRADKAATTGLGLRTSYRAEITEVNAFASWAWKNRTTAFHQFLDDLADKLVREGLREIPGVVVHEERRAV